MESEKSFSLVNNCMIRMILGLGMLATLGEARAPVLHEVGGNRFGWRLDVNFSDWAANQHFYVGDWLYFGFDKQKLSVLEVNQTGYKNCIETNFITNITKGGRDVFNLTTARPYFFISGRGYCFRGIKLAITVQEAPQQHPMTKPDHSVSRTIPKTSFITSTSTTYRHAGLIDHFLLIGVVIFVYNWSFAN